MAVKENISYISSENSHYHKEKHLLDIYIPSEVMGESMRVAPVLVFIHGGTWISGSKDLYSPIGKNFAEKGIVTVLINYRLGDIVTVDKMAQDCASALTWIYNNIGKYRGDRTKIYVAGHSAGGHLAALTGLDSDYTSESFVKGLVLIDAFGLNISRFIQEHGSFYLQYIQQVFTNNKETWEKMSPVNFISEKADKEIMVFTGTQTYPFLIHDNDLFVQRLKEKNVKFNNEKILGKNHMQMIMQMDNKNNSMYDKILDFMHVVA